jgi:hypothetical protein
MVGSTPAFDSCDRISVGDCTVYVGTDSTDVLWVEVVLDDDDKVDGDGDDDDDDDEGTDTVTDVTGTELMLEVTGIMTDRIMYHSRNEKSLQQTFSHLCKESYVRVFTAT